MITIDINTAIICTNNKLSWIRRRRDGLPGVNWSIWFINEFTRHELFSLSFHLFGIISININIYFM